MSLLALSLASLLIGRQVPKKGDCPPQRIETFTLLIRQANGDIRLILGSIKARLSTEDVSCWAATGNKAMMLELAKRLESGDGIAADPERAEDLYERAAAYVSGTTYIYSPGFGKVPGRVMPVRIGPDIPGLPEAKFRRALMHVEGRAVKANPRKGFKWLKELAKGGYAPAVERLRSLPRT
jgi:TPR repeat protein